MVVLLLCPRLSLVSAHTGLWLLHGRAGEKCEGLRFQHPRRAGVQDGPVCAATGGGRTSHPQREDEGEPDCVIAFKKRCWALLFQRLSCFLSLWISCHTFAVIVWYYQSAKGDFSKRVKPHFFSKINPCEMCLNFTAFQSQMTFEDKSKFKA